MKKTVLIIDDNDKVRQTLEDRIESMGFDFDSADCQAAAMTMLQKRRYDLILLDQELPVKKGKPTQKQVGRNLLGQIREDDNNESTPVIIVTAHDGDNSSVVSDLMLNGASYFIHKPQLEILEEKIKAVLSKQETKAKKARPSVGSKLAGTAYPGGKLTFCEGGVFLDDIRLASAGTIIARILRELCKTTGTGRRRPQSCKELAKTLNLERGDKAVAEAVSPFRKQVIDRLNEQGFAADMDTVITRGRSGYELALNIEVGSESALQLADSPPCEPTPEERQRWFIAEAEAGKKPSREHYKRQFGGSVSTWKRDLREITRVLEPVGTGSATYYRVKIRKK